MQIVARFKLDPALIMQNHGLNDGGAVQQFVDSECMRRMQSFMPFSSGAMESSMVTNTVIGSGKIITATPYSRYLYYGVLMVDPKTLKGAFHDEVSGRFWSRPGVQKIIDPAGRKLDYDTSAHPKAGSHWFDRMVSEYGDEIGKGAAQLAGGRFVK